MVQNDLNIAFLRFYDVVFSPYISEEFIQKVEAERYGELYSYWEKYKPCARTLLFMNNLFKEMSEN